MSDKRAKAIVVFVASSRTGREIVQEGLNRGYIVRAVVRSEAKFRSLVDASVCENSHLTIHACNLDSVNEIVPTISGTQVVFVATGGVELARPAYFNQDVILTILASLDDIDKENRPKRLVLLSSGSISEGTKRNHPFGYWFVRELVMRPVMEDLIQSESILKKNKNKISYTFIQPAALLAAPKTNSPIRLVEDQNGFSTAYGDLAAGMLDAGFDDSCENQMRGVVSEVRPRVTWSAVKTQRESLATLFKMYVLTPVVRASFLFALGWFIKSRFFQDRTLDIFGYQV